MQPIHEREDHHMWLHASHAACGADCIQDVSDVEMQGSAMSVLCVYSGWYKVVSISVREEGQACTSPTMEALVLHYGHKNVIVTALLWVLQVIRGQ